MSLINSNEISYMVEHNLINDVAIRFGIIGAGQKGNKDADIFAGYTFSNGSRCYPTLAVNFAKNDMLHLKNIPDKDRIHFDGFKGAARTPSLVVESFDEQYNPDAPKMIDQLSTAMEQTFMSNGELIIDHLIITAGSGGGFGTGFISLCIKLMQESYFPVPVTFLLSNPAEDHQEKLNAIVLGSEINDFQKLQNELYKNNEIDYKPLGSIIMTDNRRMMEIYNRKKHEGNFVSWKNAGNDEIVSTIHEMNIIPASFGSDNVTYDPSDFSKLLQESGSFISFHKTVVESPFAFEVIEENMKSSIDRGIFAADHNYDTANNVGFFVLRPGYAETFKDIQTEQTIMKTINDYNETAERKYGDPIWNNSYAVIYLGFSGMTLPNVLSRLNEEYMANEEKRKALIERDTEKEINFSNAIDSVKSNNFNPYRKQQQAKGFKSTGFSSSGSAFSRKETKVEDNKVPETKAAPKTFGSRSNAPGVKSTSESPWSKLKK